MNRRDFIKTTGLAATTPFLLTFHTEAPTVKNKQTVYKIVRTVYDCDDGPRGTSSCFPTPNNVGRYYSLAMHPFPFALEYKIGIPTYPDIPNSKLFAFDSIQAAKEYLTTCINAADSSVFEAEAEVAPGATPKYITGYAHTYLFDRFWDNLPWYQHHAADEYVFPTPPHTVLCNSITLIRNVGG